MLSTFRQLSRRRWLFASVVSLGVLVIGRTEPAGKNNKNSVLENILSGDPPLVEESVQRCLAMPQPEPCLAPMSQAAQSPNRFVALKALDGLLDLRQRWFEADVHFDELDVADLTKSMDRQSQIEGLWSDVRVASMAVAQEWGGPSAVSWNALLASKDWEVLAGALGLLAPRQTLAEEDAETWKGLLGSFEQHPSAEVRALAELRECQFGFIRTKRERMERKKRQRESVALLVALSAPTWIGQELRDCRRGIK